MRKYLMDDIKENLLDGYSQSKCLLLKKCRYSAVTASKFCLI